MAIPTRDWVAIENTGPFYTPGGTLTQDTPDSYADNGYVAKGVLGGSWGTEMVELITQFAAPQTFPDGRITENPWVTDSYGKKSWDSFVGTRPVIPIGLTGVTWWTRGGEDGYLSDFSLIAGGGPGWYEMPLPRAIRGSLLTLNGGSDCYFLCREEFTEGLTTYYKGLYHLQASSQYLSYGGSNSDYPVVTLLHEVTGSEEFSPYCSFAIYHPSATDFNFWYYFLEPTNDPLSPSLSRVNVSTSSHETVVASLPEGNYKGITMVRQGALTGGSNTWVQTDDWYFVVLVEVEGVLGLYAIDPTDSSGTLHLLLDLTNIQGYDPQGLRFLRYFNNSVPDAIPDLADVVPMLVTQTQEPSLGDAPEQQWFLRPLFLGAASLSITDPDPLQFPVNGNERDSTEPITLEFEVADAASEDVDVEITFQVPSEDFAGATLTPESVTTTLSTSPGGDVHSVLWRASSDVLSGFPKEAILKVELLSPDKNLGVNKVTRLTLLGPYIFPHNIFLERLNPAISITNALPGTNQMQIEGIKALVVKGAGLTLQNAIGDYLIRAVVFRNVSHLRIYEDSQLKYWKSPDGSEDRINILNAAFPTDTPYEILCLDQDYVIIAKKSVV